MKEKKSEMIFFFLPSTTTNTYIKYKYRVAWMYTPCSRYFFFSFFSLFLSYYVLY